MSFCLTQDRERSGSEVECLTGDQGIDLFVCLVLNDASTFVGH